MPQDGDTLVDRPVFSAKALRKAFQTLEPTLGRGNIDALIYDLEMYGLPLVNGRVSYSLPQIQSALEKIFGSEARMLVLRHITQKLFE